MLKKLAIIVFAIFLYSGAAFAGNFTDNGDGTVTDKYTGLIWQQEEGGGMTWGEALGYCKSLALAANTEWRLPNIKELESLVDETAYDPAITITFFPGTALSGYWSSTTDDHSPDYAWVVIFVDGNVSHLGKSSYGYVRCVR